MESPGGADDLPLPLRGKTVARCIVDTAFGIDFIEAGKRSAIRIESHFILREGGVARSLSAGRVEDMGKALVLIGKTVTRALARGDGALEVTFEDGTVLSVPPNPSTVAWEFAAPDRSFVVSLAGGGLSTRVRPSKVRGVP